MLCEACAKTCREERSSVRPGQGPLAYTREQKKRVSEHKCFGRGGEVVGDRRVGSVDAVNRETRPDQTVFLACKAPRAAGRESEHP